MRRIVGGSCAAAIVVLVWIVLWPGYGGSERLHTYAAFALSRLSEEEGNVYVVAALLQSLFVAALVTAARGWVGALVPRDLVARRRWFYAFAAFCGAAAAFACAVVLLSRTPLTEDEKTYLFQARLLLSGRLSAPTPAAFSSLNMPFLVVHGGRVSGQYFWAQPALLAIGELLRDPHLVPPCELFVTIWFGARLAEEYTQDPRVGVAAAVLLASSPVLVFTAGTLHNASLAAACAAMELFAIARLARRRDDRASALLGLAVALSMHNRLLDAAAITSGAALVVLSLRTKDLFTRETVRRLVPAAGLVALSFVLLLVIDARAYGHPFTTGYTLMNGTHHWKTFGFGVGPFGLVHSPERALSQELVSLVQVAMFATGAPVVFVLLLWPLIRPERRAVAPVAIVAVYVAAYVAYAGWEISLTGPVYHAALVVVLDVWLAVIAVRVHDVVRDEARGLVPAFVIAQTAAAVIFFWPVEAHESVVASRYSAMCEELVQDAHLDRALVLVDRPRTSGQHSWIYSPPFPNPDFSNPVLFGWLERKPAADRAFIAAHAKGRPVFRARCLQVATPTLTPWDAP